MDKKEIKRQIFGQPYANDYVKYIGKEKHVNGAFGNDIKFQIDRKMGSDNDTYVITVFDKPKPKFKVGNKTFIVS